MQKGQRPVMCRLAVFDFVINLSIRQVTQPLFANNGSNPFFTLASMPKQHFDLARKGYALHL